VLASVVQGDAVNCNTSLCEENGTKGAKDFDIPRTTLNPRTRIEPLPGFGIRVVNGPQFRARHLLLKPGFGLKAKFTK